MRRKQQRRQYRPGRQIEQAGQGVEKKRQGVSDRLARIRTGWRRTYTDYALARYGGSSTNAPGTVSV